LGGVAAKKAVSNLADFTALWHFDFRDEFIGERIANFLLIHGLRSVEPRNERFAGCDLTLV
jgi:hypothetical protein